jgi:serine/threonine protein kinase
VVAVNEPSLPFDTLDGYCLAEEVIHALACGALEEGERSKAMAHLEDCELCQALLADQVRALPGSASADDAALPTLIQLGALVAGRYRIQRFVARGGMGEVYEAWDLALSERVALKTINPLATPAAQLKASARFRQEVQLSRRVADPHVCRIYEFGQHVLRGFGMLSYLTMEFIDGETLGDRLRKSSRLEIDEVVNLSRQMLRGLGAAHGVGVLHRDFKSDNVMLQTKSTSPGGQHAVIMDFGLARLLDDQGHRLTERHELVGSAAYMAPEQLEEGAALCEATDVYAFGVVLFEMLTGRLPFDGKSAMGVALRRLSHPAPPPSSHVPELSGAWDALVLRCLERDIARRFSSTHEVAAELERIVGAAELVEPPRPPSRRRLAFAAICGAALVGGVSYLSSRRSTSAMPAPPAPEAQHVTYTLQPPAPVEPLRPEAPPPTATVAAPPIAPVLPSEPAVLPPAAPRARGATPSASPPVAAAPPEARAQTTAPRARAQNAPASPSVASPPPSGPAEGTPARATERNDDVRELFFLEPPSEHGRQKSD